MKVLVADKLPASALDQLQAAGFAVSSRPGLAGDGLRAEVQTLNPEVLIVRSTRVTADVLAAGAALGLVVRAGAGTNTIDVGAASDQGIYVANCPGKNAAAVAELAFGLLISADRQIPNNTRDFRGGSWRKKKYGAASGLHGRTLGLLGLGNIGLAMVTRAQAFGMEVLAWSLDFTDADAAELGIRRADTALEVARGSDAVSVHLALAEGTRGLVDRGFVEALKPGAIFVNTARGGIVDEVALAWGVREKGLRCGLDVFANEPSAGDAEFESRFANDELVFATHHIGASTDQAQEAVADEAVRIVCAYRDAGEVPNCVNLCERSPATHMLLVRHRDEVGVLARVFDRLRGAEINVQETQNTIFEGARAAIAHVWLDREPAASVLADIRRSDAVLAASLVVL